ncbi:GT2 family glycosyltransferase [Lachnotalea glycerini]|uniref:GT2 family glycosyltransferase n=1 Tax=Lachnotalea glycerini TaxID=1763509 RepID=A0A318ET80_9FIRM|nr:glycosyltransferase [Lachnotalea glycerini]PXV91448.1 GT2 family glycosyltransferase [Lachnotalea glycerini]
MKFGIFVLLYNPEINEVIMRLKKYSQIFGSFLVVDNSQEDYSENLNKELPSIKYHTMNENKGISKALNYAFKWAYKEEIDFLLTMDQDSEYPNEEIEKLLHYIETYYEENVGIYSANYKKIYYNVKKDMMMCSNLSLKWDEVKDVKFCMTSGSFVNINAVQRALPLDNYFVSYVDVDLSMWFLENGYKLKRVGNSVFQQQVGNMVNANKLNMIFHVLHHNEKRYYFMTRNNFYFKSKYKKYKLYAFKRLIRIYVNILLGEKNKIKKIKASYLGYLHYKQGVMGDLPINSSIEK